MSDQHTVWVGAALLAAGSLLAACSSSAPPSKDVVVTVNDRPLTQTDVQLFERSPRGHEGRMAATPGPETLDTLIVQELAAQQAIALELDANPGFQESVRLLEAQVAAFRRKQLSELYFQHASDQAAAVTDIEAQDYFKLHAGELRTEYHLLQILRRDAAQIEDMQQQLASGKPFGEVARSQFPQLPDNVKKPWDLGFLRWEQIPEEWREPLAKLAPGETSSILRGANNRFWLIQLVEKRENPGLDFAQAQAQIVARLKADRMHEASINAEHKLREQARIVYREDASSGSQKQ